MYPGISYKHLWHGLIFVSEISINENKWQHREMSLPKLSKFDLLPSMLLNRADGIFSTLGYYLESKVVSVFWLLV